MPAYRSLVAAGSAALLLTGSAFAHELGVEDGDEGNGIDIERVTQGHPSETPYSAHLVSFVIDTYQPFTNADLQRPEGDNPAIAIRINTDRDDGFERIVFVDVQEDSQDPSGFDPYVKVTAGRAQGDADRDSFTPRRRLVGYGRVRRPADDTIELVIPERLLAKGGLDRFRWRARFVSSDQQGVGFDYVPDIGEADARGHTS